MTLIRLRAGTPTIEREDEWTSVADGEALPDGIPATVSLERWQAERDSLATRNAPVGVWLRSDQRIEEIVGHLASLPLIALEFPNLNDGRHFTTARLLRERYGYAGEIRAVGRVLGDQLFFMARCGFDAFELAPGKDADGARKAFGEISVVYQPAADRRVPASALRMQAVRATAAE